VLGEENENEGERNTAFPLKTPASIFYKRKMGYTKLICDKVDKSSSFMRVPVAHSVFITGSL
jgi:hypothetical protein